MAERGIEAADGRMRPAGWRACAARSRICRIDVDRLGVVALDATTRMLEMAPLGLKGAPRPTTLVFKCSHGVYRESAATTTPTFPSRDLSDRRPRQSERLRAGEALVRSFCRHVEVNQSLEQLEVLAAPLRLHDWTQFGAAVRTNCCPLRYLSLAGSQLRDSGLRAVGGAVLAHPTLVALNLSACELGTASIPWVVRILHDSSKRQKSGRILKLNREWAATLCDGRSGWPADAPDRARDGSVFDELPEEVGISCLGCVLLDAT